MTGVQQDFLERAQEVELYFRFLQEFDEQRVAFQPPPSGTPPFTHSDRESLWKTLKANGFLLLYNLVESTVKNAIEAIFDDLKAKGISFDACRNEVRQIVLTNLKRHNVDKILPSLSTISIDVVVATFRKEELFAGNVDGRRLRKVAQEYGFAHPRVKSDELLTVKTNRNDLAHGNKSFAEVGRDFDVVRLIKIKSEVIVFLEELMKNIADYIANGAYLGTTGS